MTQQNAALVEESSAATESLREQAGRLAEVVGVFRLAERPSRLSWCSRRAVELAQARMSTSVSNR